MLLACKDCDPASQALSHDLGTDLYELLALRSAVNALLAPKWLTSPLGLPSNFVRNRLLLLRSGDVRELAAASYPHSQCGGSDFPGIAGGLCGERRLA